MIADVMSDIEEYISIADFAKLANVSRQAILKAVKDERLKAVRLGRAYVIKKSALVDYLQMKKNR